jgi:hypothetical protein
MRISYRRGDELGDDISQINVSLDGIAILHDESVEKGQWPTAEGSLRVLASHDVDIIGEALNIEELPWRKRVVNLALLGLALSLFALKHADWIAGKRQGQDGTAFANIDMICCSLICRPMVIVLPRSRCEIFADDGVILEDKEAASLSNLGRFKGAVHVSLVSWSILFFDITLFLVTHLSLAPVALPRNEMLIEFVHVKVILHAQMKCSKHEWRRIHE